jgi:hypothetical protein
MESKQLSKDVIENHLKAWVDAVATNPKRYEDYAEYMHISVQIMRYWKWLRQNGGMSETSTESFIFETIYYQMATHREYEELLDIYKKIFQIKNLNKGGRFEAGWYDYCQNLTPRQGAAHMQRMFEIVSSLHHRLRALEAKAI